MSTIKGSCNCGAYTWTATNTIQGTAVCHCLPCRKTAGTNGSTNIIVADSDLKVLSGTPKHWTRKGDSGQNVTYSFCSECFTFMSVDAESMPGMTILKTGTVDEPREVLDQRPGIEIYTKYRPAAFTELEGLAHFEGPPS